MENQSSVTGWQELFFSYRSFSFSVAVAITTSEIYGLKNYSLPNNYFNMLFQLKLTKFFKSELFLCLLKVDYVIN